MEALLSRHPWNANKVSVTGAGLDVCIFLAFYSLESCKILFLFDLQVFLPNLLIQGFVLC